MIYRHRRRHNLLVASVGGDEKNVSAKLDVVRVALAWKSKKYSQFSEDDPRLNHGVVLHNVEKNKKRCSSSSIKGQIEAQQHLLTIAWPRNLQGVKEDKEAWKKMLSCPLSSLLENKKPT